MDYNIYHMFPKLLNLYGDRGNILTLSYYAKQLGLNPVVHEIDNVDNIDWENVDFMLIGGGSDREQALVTGQLSKIKDKLKKEVDNGLPVLAVCGGYQFLGKFYKDTSGNILDGLSVLDMETVGQTKQRMLGNLIVESDKFGTIVGFVNHAGETFHNLDKLGTAINGKGNNLDTNEEGIIYQNLVGTYLHGPLLPKNPNITKFFLQKFMEKNNLEFNEQKIDTSFEEEARQNMLNKISKEGNN
ncbi:type 1 glutamine amidotransferase [Mycoplasma sp. P36-A1]|uniref:type 1 glutamine amidotransferase n=1 Tax=Mycoplasma sp. P36-A1 TaxID=3252900 RepID=UPI003C2F3859